MSERLLEFRNFSAWWGERKVLDSISWVLPPHTICAVIGPSGIGKTTFLRSVNRLNEDIPGWRTTGAIYLNGSRNWRDIPTVELRRRVGMVFQKPVVFPRSILENTVFGLRYAGLGEKRHSLKAAEKALRAAHLWEEVRERLNESALKLSIGQQQRLCLARALAVEPELLLLDEPTASLDSRSQAAVEQTLLELKQRYSLVVVTHDLLQAQRLADEMVRL